MVLFSVQKTYISFRLSPNETIWIEYQILFSVHPKKKLFLFTVNRLELKLSILEPL